MFKRLVWSNVWGKAGTDWCETRSNQPVQSLWVLNIFYYADLVPVFRHPYFLYAYMVTKILTQQMIVRNSDELRVLTSPLYFRLQT